MERIIKVGAFTFTFTSVYEVGSAERKHIYVTPTGGVYCRGTDCRLDKCPFADYTSPCESQAKALFSKYTKVTRTKAYHEKV